MVQIIPENGTGLANANSYATVPEADEYFASHPYYADNWDALGEPDKESLLVLATAQVDALINWNGVIVSHSQALAWPRYGVVDSEGRFLPQNTVPQRVKFAVFEMAFQASRGDPYAPSASAGVERIKIDVIELEFGGSTIKAPVPAAALVLLRGLGEYALGRKVRKVVVG